MHFTALKQLFVEHPDLLNITHLSYDVVEDWSGGSCVPPSKHQTRCLNQTSGDVFCDCLADAANVCAQMHDENWWLFTACMFHHNGANPNAGVVSGLEVESTFEPTVRACAEINLKSYSFAELKECYTSRATNEALRASANQSSAADAKWGKGQIRPVWAVVGGVLIDGDVYGHDGDGIPRWVAAVKNQLCEVYTGPAPAACANSSMQDEMLV